MLKKLRFIILLAVFCFSFHSNQARAEYNFTLEDFLELAQNEDIDSVESFVGALPEFYRSGYALMFRSRSLHDATFQTPRVLFYGVDAKVVIAFSATEGDRHKNVIEAMSYDEKEAKFNFYALDFDAKDERLEINPKICSGCHAQDARPNWHSYSVWPGAYGSFHDRVHRRSRMNEEYQRFLVSAVEHPRYKFLPLERIDEIKTSRTLYTVAYGGSSNAVMGVFLAMQNYDRIARRIHDEKHNEAYRYAVLAALMGCQTDPMKFIPVDLREDHSVDFSTLRQETEESLKKHYFRDVRIAYKDTGFDQENMMEFAYWNGEADRGDLMKDNIQRMSLLRFFLEQRGTSPMNMKSWSMNFGVAGRYNFNDGFGGIDNMLHRYLELAFPGDSEIYNLIKWKPFFLKFDSRIGTGVMHAEYDNSDEVCKKLAEIVTRAD